LVLGLVVVENNVTLQVQTDFSRIQPHASTSASLAWPAQGSAAIDVPGSGFSASDNADVLPIASLTKLMTAYLMLKALPLQAGQSGPCWSVTHADADLYEGDRATDQSSVLVEPGEQLCEYQILEGMVVHSASNFTTIAVELVNKYAPASLQLQTPAAFITAMNETASQLGMVNTTYVDSSGFSPANVSTASDVLLLTKRIMQNPVFATVANMSSATFPYAGTVGTFTPELGSYGVVGVKSGRTSAAGGCDAMARTLSIDGHTQTVYVVVLGQTGDNVLSVAGQAALRLSDSVVAGLSNAVIPRNLEVGHLVVGAKRVAFVTSRPTTLYWWTVEGRVRELVHLDSGLSHVAKGQRIGSLIIQGSRRYVVPLLAKGALSTPSLWQRIR